MAEAAEEFLCARCAKHQKTCCQDTDIVLTLGDVRRVRQATGREDFYEHRESTDPVYLKQDDDPIWRERTFRPDGTRRLLKQQSNGDCIFLGTQGCTLSLEARPLICRLYPFDYTEDGISPHLARGCPIELLRPGQRLLEVLDMNLADARRWHQQLYAEIRLEEAELEEVAI